MSPHGADWTPSSWMGNPTDKDRLLLKHPIEPFRCEDSNIDLMCHTTMSGRRTLVTHSAIELLEHKAHKA